MEACSNIQENEKKTAQLLFAHCPNTENKGRLNHTPKIFFLILLDSTSSDYACIFHF